MSRKKPPTLEENISTAIGKITATTGVTVDAVMVICSVSTADNSAQLVTMSDGNRHTLNGMLEEFYDTYDAPPSEPETPDEDE